MRGRWSPRSVRTKATAGATLVIAIALVVAAIALMTTLRGTQLDTIDNALELQTDNIEGLLSGGANPTSVAGENDEHSFVQIVDQRGTVLAASKNLERHQTVAIPTDDDTIALDGDEYRSGDGDDEDRLSGQDQIAFRIHSTETDSGVTITVGTELENFERTQGALVRALAIGVPIMVTFAGILVWIVIGRALHPVEMIRRGVDEIEADQPDQRVPVPATRDEISNLATTMNRMLDRLQLATERQTRFVSDASHELRTPIAIVQHELEVALRAATLEHWQQTGDELLEENQRMQRLVDDLLLMAHLGASPADQGGRHGSLVDVDDVVLDELRRRPFNIAVDASGVSAGQIRGDRDQIGRVVRNLLDNAVRHADSTIAIRVTSSQGRVTIEVDDDGVGVDEELRAHIFERFGRADQARDRQHGGVGLGLAIAREIVLAHTGSIEVGQSTDLGGAAFTVHLPDARTT